MGSSVHEKKNFSEKIFCIQGSIVHGSSVHEKKFFRKIFLYTGEYRSWGVAFTNFFSVYREVDLKKNFIWKFFM